MALIIPSVFADAINAKLDTTLRIGRVAFDATSVIPEIRQAGDTIHFPTINRVATAGTVIKGTALTPAVIDMTDSSATIQWVGSSMRVYDSEKAQIKGRVMDNVVEQVATAMAKKIDNDLTVAMDTDAVFKQATTAATTITVSEIYQALANFGDDIDTDTFAGIIINSRLLKNFLAMDEFVSANKTYQTNGNGIVNDGVAGYFIGIPVIICNNGTYDTAKAECKTYIVKKNALGYVFQKEISIEEEREAKLLATDIVASSLYACKLLDLKGVVIARKTIA